jgi:hypothetical protein
MNEAIQPNETFEYNRNEVTLLGWRNIKFIAPINKLYFEQNKEKVLSEYLTPDELKEFIQTEIDNSKVNKALTKQSV